MTLEEALTAAKKTMSDAAKAYAAKTEPPRIFEWEALCAAAEGFTKAQWALKAPAKEDLPASAAVVPFGRDKGKALGDVDDKAIEWLRGVVGENVNDPAKANYKRKNEVLLRAVELEAERRGL